eukprot:6059396-Alexandrium_andersonii.AAC.1
MLARGWPLARGSWPYALLQASGLGAHSKTFPILGNVRSQRAFQAGRGSWSSIVRGCACSSA